MLLDCGPQCGLINYNLHKPIFSDQTCLTNLSLVYYVIIVMQQNNKMQLVALIYVAYKVVVVSSVTSGSAFGLADPHLGYYYYACHSLSQITTAFSFWGTSKPLGSYQSSWKTPHLPKLIYHILKA